MDLSILIATVKPREKYLNRLLNHLQKQIIDNDLVDRVEVIINQDNLENNIGYKRNVLYGMAQGKYLVSLDDDDWVSDDYCKTICDVIENHDGVDQICIGHRYYRNNKEVWSPMTISKNNPSYKITFLKNFSIYYNQHIDEKTGFELHFKNKPILKSFDLGIQTIIFKLFCELLNKQVTQPNGIVRYTAHTTPIRKDIAQLIKFKKLSINEDIEWTTEIQKKSLIKTEYVIDSYLYDYYYDDEMSVFKLSDKGRVGLKNTRKILNKVLNNGHDIDWGIKEVDKINIKWVY